MRHLSSMNNESILHNVKKVHHIFHLTSKSLSLRLIEHLDEDIFQTTMRESLINQL